MTAGVVLERDGELWLRYRIARGTWRTVSAGTRDYVEAYAKLHELEQRVAAQAEKSGSRELSVSGRMAAAGKETE